MIKLRITAIDPGDRWVGLAAIHSMPDKDRGEKYGLNIAVMDRSKRSIRETADIALQSRPRELVIEEFRARPQGHQAFSELKTPRLIGALEYAFQEPVTFIPPGNPFEDVPRLLGKDLVKLWRGGMDSRGHDRWDAGWNHGWSAWRALALFLLHRNPDFLLRLREASRHEFRMSNFSFPTGWQLDPSRDLTSRTLIWRPT